MPVNDDGFGRTEKCVDWSRETKVAVQLANGHRRTAPRPQPEPGEQRPREQAQVLVDEFRLVPGDAVESQDPRLLVQVDADPPGLGRAQELPLAAVPEGEAARRPAQAPGPSVVAQAAAVVGGLALHLPVGHADGDLHGGEDAGLGKEAYPGWC
ncbi:hypothetical protein EYF80_058768 [Liparis tanakae]|uniref:Uncharacterized protein n=1 Tax=Liparis tanakae TaxID=230148 RepID=A0A4Z2ER42_9TELE|nr:hypothetical protein EYF80_058768 [Liparis tanakae]